MAATVLGFRSIPTMPEEKTLSFCSFILRTREVFSDVLSKLLLTFYWRRLIYMTIPESIIGKGLGITLR